VCEHREYEVKPPTKKADRECRQLAPCSKDECEKTKAVEAPFATMNRTSYTASWANTPRTLTWMHRTFPEATFKEPTRCIWPMACSPQGI
jgi:hypothetical protein